MPINHVKGKFELNHQKTKPFRKTWRYELQKAQSTNSVQSLSGRNYSCVWLHGNELSVAACLCEKWQIISEQQDTTDFDAWHHALCTLLYWLMLKWESIVSQIMFVTKSGGECSESIFLYKKAVCCASRLFLSAQRFFQSTIQSAFGSLHRLKDTLDQDFLSKWKKFMLADGIFVLARSTSWAMPTFAYQHALSIRTYPFW